MVCRRQDARQPAIDAVRDGRIKVVPETWAKTWFNWLENIQPWCVSRQLWWGHRIPAWFDEDGEVFVAETEEQAQQLAGAGRSLTRDADVLDTWFSSALWPFATLGWPDAMEPPSPRLRGEGESVGAGAASEQAARSPLPTLSPKGERTSLLGGRYPNDILISGFDILFFWDARMAMQGMHFLKEVPFKTLYLHGLVRDATGAKMSKSKGNTVDPLGLIDRYGADALRFTMAAMESQGRDIKLDEKRVEGYRNFATKLWNAARFLQSNGVGASTTLEPPAASLPVNRWIIAETVGCVQALDLALADLRFDEAANTIYQFVWSRFCDWYIELTKPATTDGERAAVDEETKAVAGWAFDQILVMLHPFMPFITEELWHAMGPREHELIVAKWPMADARALDPEAAKEIDWLIRLVSEIRAARSELNVPPGVAAAGPRPRGRVDDDRAARQSARGIARLARVDEAAGDAPAGAAAQIVVDEATFVLPLEGRDRHRRRARAPRQGQGRRREGARLARRPALQRQLRRARQARGDRQGARRPCRQGGGSRTAGRGAGATGVSPTSSPLADGEGDRRRVVEG